MSVEVSDAYGRPVSELSTCTRCGASIKYVFFHEGKPYGSDCIEVVTGISKDYWVLRDGNKLDARASRERKAEVERKRQERIQAQEELDRKQEATRVENKVRFAELIAVLNEASHYIGDFCSEMAQSIGNAGFSTSLNEILSYRQFQVIREIWGKQRGGRMNSKAYNAAVVEFDEKFDDETEGDNDA